MYVCNCSSLKYLDLSSFDISKSKDCNYMMDTGTSTTIKANPLLRTFIDFSFKSASVGAVILFLDITSSLFLLI